MQTRSEMNEREPEMPEGGGGVAFHFERGAFSTAGWFALNRQYYLLTLARGVGQRLTKSHANFGKIICAWFCFILIGIRDSIISPE